MTAHNTNELYKSIRFSSRTKNIHTCTKNTGAMPSARGWRKFERVQVMRKLLVDRAVQIYHHNFSKLCAVLQHLNIHNSQPWHLISAHDRWCANSAGLKIGHQLTVSLSPYQKQHILGEVQSSDRFPFDVFLLIHI